MFCWLVALCFDGSGGYIAYVENVKRDVEFIGTIGNTSYHKSTGNTRMFECMETWKQRYVYSNTNDSYSKDNQMKENRRCFECHNMEIDMLAMS